MDLSQLGDIHIFRLPIDTSMLATLRQQLWSIVDRSVDLPNLTAAPLVSCHRLDQQPLTYRSAVAHQLFQNSPRLPSVTTSCSSAVGNQLLQLLATAVFDQPTAQWQGVINSQGYLYLQPTTEAITASLNQLLKIKTPRISHSEISEPTAAAITLQYIYIRCIQLLQAIPTEIFLQINTTEFTIRTTSEKQLIAAILDVWDHICSDSTFSNCDRRRLLKLSQQLVEQFLEFEKDCCLSAKNKQLSKNFHCCLLTLVQTTAKTILQQYWGIEPLQHW